jgi:hypothetical protein
MTEERALLALRVSDVSRHGELGRSGRPLSGGEGGQANVVNGQRSDQDQLFLASADKWQAGEHFP